jgi:hypothetical protein
MADPIEVWKDGALLQRLVPDPAQETVIADMAEYIEVEEVLVNELLPAAQRVPVERRRRRDPKPGSRSANEASMRAGLPGLAGTVKTIMDRDRGLQARAVAARQAIPNQASTTVANLRTAMLEQLQVEREAAQNRIELGRVVVVALRLLDGDFSAPAEPAPEQG